MLVSQNLQIHWVFLQLMQYDSDSRLLLLRYLSQVIIEICCNIEVNHVYALYLVINKHIYIMKLIRNYKKFWRIQNAMNDSHTHYFGVYKLGSKYLQLRKLCILQHPFIKYTTKHKMMQCNDNKIYTITSNNGISSESVRVYMVQYSENHV